MNLKYVADTFEKNLFTSILILPFTLYIFLNGGSPIIFSINLFLLFFDLKFNISKYFIYSILFFLLYNNIIYYDTHLKFHELRLRYFSLMFLFFTLLINYIAIRKSYLIKFINGFFIFCSFNLIIFFIANSFKSFDRDLFLNNLNFKYKAKNFSITRSDYPVILIILDEFSSTKEIFNHTRDSIDLKLDLFMKDQGYQVLNDYKTKSTRTSISLPSIFNFNLHSGLENDSIELLDKGLQKIDGFVDAFRYNLLIDSLLKKSVKSYSFGIDKFYRGVIDDDFYYHWEERNNLPTLNKVINATIVGTYLNGINRDFINIDLFRKKTFERLINLKPKKNSFYYFHLFFPHDPFSYFEEYPNKKLNYITLSEDQYLEEHIKYKRWFVNKFIQILSNKKFENSRIIIAGDHGFRYNKKINPELTNIYLKGYDSIKQDKYMVIQDLGNLIFESFN